MNKVQRIDDLPQSSWGLPYNDGYVQLGCNGCSYAVRLKMPWNMIKLPTDDARIITDSVPSTTVHQGSTCQNYFNDCAKPCPNRGNIEAAAVLLEAL
jgi:hypothetical protein